MTALPSSRATRTIQRDEGYGRSAVRRRRRHVRAPTGKLMENGVPAQIVWCSDVRAREINDGDRLQSCNEPNAWFRLHV